MFFSIVSHNLYLTFRAAVYGFDPNPIMHTRVCESLVLNGWNDDGHDNVGHGTTKSSSLPSVQLFANGLGERPGMLNLTTGHNPGGSSFFEDRLAKKFRKKISVPVIRLDDLAVQQGWIFDNDNNNGNNDNKNRNKH